MFQQTWKALSAARPRLAPVEKIVLVLLFAAFVVVDLAGRPYFFVLGQSLAAIATQGSWLVPCILGRYLFHLLEVPYRRARLFYLVYFAGLTLLFFVSGIEAAFSAANLEGQAAAASALALTAAWIARSVWLLNAVLLAVAGLITLLAVRSGRTRSHRALSVAKQELADAGRIVRLLIFLALAASYYSNLKAMIPLLNPIVFDGLFYRLDRLLFLGADPFRLLTGFGGATLAALMERSYFFFFFFIVFGLAGAFLFGSTKYFEKVFASFIVAYFLGLMVYIALPALGPAFHPETSALFKATQGNELKQYLWSHYRFMLEHPHTAPVARFDGLAAFPSLHVAHSMLFMYYLWHKEKIVVALLAVPFVLLTLSTLYLGWHWIVDLVGGVGVAWLTVRIVERMYPSEPTLEAAK